MSPLLFAKTNGSTYTQDELRGIYLHGNGNQYANIVDGLPVTSGVNGANLVPINLYADLNENTTNTIIKY